MSETSDTIDAPQTLYAPAQQRRGIRTERKLLEAAKVLFGERGYAQTRVSDIIERSGVSNGSFYHRFSDKAAVFCAIHQQYVQETTARIDRLDMSRQTNGDLPGLLRQIAEQTYDVVQKNLGFYRAAQELETELPEIRRALSGLTLRICDRLAVHYSEYSTQITAPDPVGALRAAAQVAVMIMVQVRLGTGPAFPRERAPLLDIATRAACGVACYRPD
ncbi:MAG: TetR/AcrR family transcriptional regulator [Pararhodobacter sp.]|nr:TetR/AcrR family transcriptional regulator [Pararhodobacter sp.]